MSLTDVSATTSRATSLYQDAFSASVVYFNGDELAAKVFLDKYALRDSEGALLEKTPEDMHRRIARELVRIEAKKFSDSLTFDTIFNYLDRFKYIVPQGSPMYGIGNNKQFSTLSNCYVIAPPLDSYGDILRADQELVQISKRRGGVGLDVSNIRPAKTRTNNAARAASGVPAFMSRFSNTIREVGQDGRRGALMLTISVHHPEVLDFANAKRDATKVTGANISIRYSNEFLQAVRDGTDYEQRWPIKGTPKVRRRVDARTVWREIVATAHETAEPGVLFWDNITSESPADCYEAYETVGTNPCSELPLSADDSCRLLLLNLLSYVVNPYTKDAYFDYARFYADAMIAQRLMDDIVDLELEAIDRIIAKVESDPEPETVKQVELSLWRRIRIACFNGRRTGTGITALGDMLAAVGVKYGNEESIAITEQVYRILKLGCYRASVDMAKLCGAFPVWDAEREKSNPFLLRIKDEDPALYADMQKFGRRNIAALTTAPAGSISIETQTTSGIEPAFMLAYKRRKKVNPSDESARVDFTDASGDCWEEFIVYHPGVKAWMAATGKTDITESPYHGATAEEIDWRQRVKLQAAANRHVDHAISSTLNLPEDVSVEAVAEIFETAWLSGCKGITVYRKNCRTGVLIAADTKAEDRLVKTLAPKRAVDMPCDVYHPICGGVRYFVLVGLMGGEPYEVIAGTSPDVSVPRSVTTGVCRKIKKGVYPLLDDEGETLLENAAAHCQEDQEALLRMVSTSLRHGADIKFVVEQLEKVRGGLHSFAKGLSRCLKKYIPDGTVVSGEACGECGETSLVRSAGCVTCVMCGWSKC